MAANGRAWTSSVSKERSGWSKTLTLSSAREHVRIGIPRRGKLQKSALREAREPPDSDTYYYTKSRKVDDYKSKYMSQYEADMMKLLTQIVEDLRWIRVSLEERDRIRQEENEDLLKRIEKTHRGPTSE